MKISYFAEGKVLWIQVEHIQSWVKLDEIFLFEVIYARWVVLWQTVQCSFYYCCESFFHMYHISLGESQALDFFDVTANNYIKILTEFA